MKVATQTYVAAVFWLIVLGMMLYVQRKAKAIDITINVAGILISALVNLYAINCMVVGNCGVFTWFYVALLGLSVVLALVGVSMGAGALKAMRS